MLYDALETQETNGFSWEVLQFLTDLAHWSLLRRVHGVRTPIKKQLMLAERSFHFWAI